VYEDRNTAPIPHAAFVRRVIVHAAVSVAVIAGSLGLGMAGYAYYEGLGWCDAFLNAAMLLGGEGPLQAPHTQAGKLFAGLYALYSGLVFLVVVSIILAPVAHRVLHRFHWAGADDDAP
jgi:hypothetical protein